MKIRNNPIILLLAVSLAGLVLLTGCATGGSSSSGSRSRGKLTEATRESAGEEEENERSQGRTRTKDEVFGSDYGDVGDDVEGGSGMSALAWGLFSGGGDDQKSSVSDQGGGGGSDLKRNNLNLWYSRSELAGDVIRGFDTFTLMLSGFSGSRIRGQIGLYYGWGKLGSRQYVQEGLRWVRELGLDGGARFYFTPDHSFMGFYALGGIRAGILHWSYTKAIKAPTAGGGYEEISHDELFQMAYYLGIGTSLVQTKAVHFGASLTAGVNVTHDKTFKDFDNDLFKDVGEIKLNLEASIFF